MTLYLLAIQRRTAQARGVATDKAKQRKAEQTKAIDENCNNIIFIA